MEVDEIDDIFDRNIDQLDVRETPRWELSEEEESVGSDVETLVNQHQSAKKMANGQVPRREMSPRTVPPISAPATASLGQSLAMKQSSPMLHPSVAPTQSPVMKRSTDSPVPKVNVPCLPQNTSSGGSIKTSPSPKLYRHLLDKENIDALVKSAYKETSDSVKDFGASERGQNPVQLGKGKSLSNRETPDVHVWDEDDVDSLKDFTGNDRKKEEKYMERTDEVIYQRAAEEHIRRPPLWHDEEVDSVRDFSRTTGKQEPTSGLTSQQLSRLPSDEHLCLSPPWNEEDDGPVGDFIPVTEQPVVKNFSINNMVMEERMRQAGQQPPPCHEQDEVDSTRDFAAQFRKTRSMENSRRPSEENIYLTPPWMEDDQQQQSSCGGRSGLDHFASSRSYRMTLEEQRAIEEEARNLGMTEAEDKVQALREDKAKEKVHPGITAPVAGRDSGFGSEQDRHTLDAGQGPPTNALSSGVLTQGDASIAKDVKTDQTMSKPLSVVTTNAKHNILQSTKPPATQTKMPTAVNPADDIGRVNQPLPSNRERPHRCTTAPQEIRPGLATGNPAGAESAATQSRGIARSVSQTSVEAICYSPHDALEGLETSSVVSFASTAATHHDLDTRIDMVQSLLSMLGTHDKDDMSRTLLAMSNSKDSCAAMRQSGCLPLLIDLLHGKGIADKNARREARARAGLALHNIVYSNVEDRRGRREVRVLRLLEIARAHCDVIQFKGLPVHPCAERWYPPLRDYGPGPAVAALMKLSFEEDHRKAICELGGLQAIADLLQIDHQINEHCKDFYSISLRKYAGMTLTNLTFGNIKNKNLLCSIPGAVEAIIAQLNTVEEEEIIQVSASVLRNLSWRADELCRKTLRDTGAISALLSAAQAVHGEPALRTTLSALWNLSAHCSENKSEICAAPCALKFLVKCLKYSSLSGNISVVESSGGILRNLSSHIAVRPDYRKTLRDCGCFQVLLCHLRSSSLRVVSNVCGALWNLSARCLEDQELLWELGAVSLLKSLVNSKHKAISQSSTAALRNLMAVKPSSSTDSESVSSRAARLNRSMPANMRTAAAQAQLKSDVARLKNRSPRAQSPQLQVQGTQQSLTVNQTVKRNYEPPAYDVAVSNIQQSVVSQPMYPQGQGIEQGESFFPGVTRQDIEVAANQKQVSARKKTGSSGSLAHSSSSSNHGGGGAAAAAAGQEEEPSTALIRTRSDIGPRSLAGRQRRAKARGGDVNSVGTVSVSFDGRNNSHFKWSQSNDSLSKHRRQPHRDMSGKKEHDKLDGDQRCLGPASGSRPHHSRSSSDGCAVIPLLSDSYPLHVSQKPKKTDSLKEKVSIAERSVLSRIKNSVHKNTERAVGQAQQSVPQQGDGMSLVSPSTARRLNQWTNGEFGETYEMAEFIPQEVNEVRSRQAPDQSSTSRPYQRSAQKFKSYRDSDSEIDSEVEVHLFGQARKPTGYPEASNAWIQNEKSEVYSHRSADTESVASSTCSCEHVENIWIRRPESKSLKSTCGKCSRPRKGKSSEKLSAVNKPMVKSRRDSTDSPISSPNFHRVFQKSTGREQKNAEILDPSKRGVKVTSL